MSIHTIDRAHEVLADQALLVAEAADVLYDMAMQPTSRHEDLADLEAVYAEGGSFPATIGMSSVVAAMFVDLVELGRRLALQPGPLPTSMVSQCQVARRMARTMSDALETGTEQGHVQTLNRCAASLQDDAGVGTDLATAAAAAQQALHTMLQSWALGI
ncbi:MAG: hypothetical protein R2720_02340 [Candidatus Nanopelagicales bacterium]